MWLTEPDGLVAGNDVGFLTQLGMLCAEAKVQNCENERCCDRKRVMDKAAPACDWKAFRDWALVAMSCQEAFSHEQKLSKAHSHLVTAVHSCVHLLESCKSDPKIFHVFLDECSRVPVDLLGVCNIIHWMAAIQDWIGLGAATSQRWDHDFLPANITIHAIDEASRKIQELGMCKNRIRNLVNLAERKQSDLPEIVSALESRQALLRHDGHNLCTPSKYQFAHRDCTKVGQRHKCSSPQDCEQSRFPVDLLETALELKNGTAWSSTRPCLSSPHERYIAISHVWSDGAGVGTKVQGSVNRCLFDYFAHIAESLECKAVWWDALSIPSEANARNKALNQMHRNYANAEYTVHNQYLLDLIR
jgi:hypothetical protein